MGAFRYRQQQTGLVYDLLPPEVQAGPLPHTRFERKPDVSDAEFITVIPIRSKASSATSFNDNGRYPRPVYNATASSVATIARVCIAAGERWLQRGSRRTFAVLVAAVFVLVFGLVGGFSGLSPAPAASVPAAAAPLVFSHVTLTPRDANGMRMLVVSGIIENRTDSAVPVTEIKADLVSGNRLLSSIVITPPTGRLEAGASRGFSARLQHPGGKMPEVRLSFLP
jgi:hypothetical protein